MYYITKYDSPNYTSYKDTRAVFGRDRVISGITIHHWGDPKLNPTFTGVVNWLCNKASGVSAHLVVEDGRAAWLVDAKDTAWHAGAVANPTTIGIEANPRASQGDIRAVAEVIADIRHVYGDIMIYGHNYWMSTACPGRYDVYELDRLSYQAHIKKYGYDLRTKKK